jgi:dCMP deaminase
MSTRPEWDEYWFTQAIIYSTRGTCDRLRTACVIVRDNRFISAGYNGSPPHTPHCDDVGHIIIDGHCERTLHAEENAILSGDRNLLKKSVAYVLDTPCTRCAKLLVAAGVIDVKYLREYPNSRGKEYLDGLSAESGVTFNRVNLDPLELIQKTIKRLGEKGGVLFIP